MEGNNEKYVQLMNKLVQRMIKEGITFDVEPQTTEKNGCVYNTVMLIIPSNDEWQMNAVCHPDSYQAEYGYIEIFDKYKGAFAMTPKEATKYIKENLKKEVK